MKIKFFDIKNLRLSLKALATSIVTGVVWSIPMFLVRYVVNQLNVAVSLTIGVVSLIGYVYTWGYLARIVFNIKD